MISAPEYRSDDAPVLFRNLLKTVLLALALWSAQGASAQTFPRLTGRVVDEAKLLDPAQKAAIDGKLAALETQSQRQVVVVTLADLQGYEIADYGFRLGDHWGIGDKDRDDGVLLIVAPNERKVRIEVGYGLEGILPDALAGRIIRNQVVPRFKANDYAGGIEAGVDAIIAQLQLPPEEARALANQAKEAARNENDGNGNALFFILFILMFFVLPMVLRRWGGKRYRYGAAPVILWGPGIGGRSSRGGWSGGGGFSGGGGSFGGGGASGGW